MSAPLLAIEDLSVAFQGSGGTVIAAQNVSLAISRGEILALVGESGSGKTITALSVLKLLPYPKASHPSGKILLEGKNLLDQTEAQIRTVRGQRISMIFQEPMTSLNPLHTIGRQLSEIVQLHTPTLTKPEIRTRIHQLLADVGLEKLQARLDAYPFELSGGQRQRIMIAMALANAPDLLIADEPTTALDVTVQAQILKLLLKLRKERNMAILLITHDLSLVRRVADRVAVMQQGKVVEQNTVNALFAAPQHIYTKQLLAATPGGAPAPAPDDAPPLLTVEHLDVHFPVKKGAFGRVRDWVRAVDDVTLTVRKGHTLGIVGESGSGKTTLAQAALRLIASKGTIHYRDILLSGLRYRELRPLRQELQFVFQDPFSSLNPRLNVSRILREGLIAHRIGTRQEQEERVAQALTEVGLKPEMQWRYPHEFSGGQRQRISIARALVLRPRCIVFDEPTSALDVSTQSDILKLLKSLQQKYQLTYLFISHDLRVIRALAHDVIVMRHGKIVEQGSRETIFNHPRNAYTKALLEAALLDA